MESDQKFDGFELTDQQLEDVVGGFTEGETLYLKSGRTTCTVCGMRNITSFTYAGKGNVRLALVTLPCGHQTYIPERALQATEP